MPIEVGDDFGGDDVGGREVGGFFEGYVFQPEDVQVQLVAFDQFIVAVGLESLGLCASTPVFLVVAGDEVVQVAAFQSVFLQREMQIGSQVIDPELLCPRSFLSRLAVEEQDVRFESLSIKDPDRKSQQSMHVGLFQQLAADGFAGSAFEQHIVRQNHGSSPVLLQNREDVLQEVQLFVAGCCPGEASPTFGNLVRTTEQQRNRNGGCGHSSAEALPSGRQRDGEGFEFVAFRVRLLAFVRCLFDGWLQAELFLSNESASLCSSGG